MVLSLTFAAMASASRKVRHSRHRADAQRRGQNQASIPLKEKMEHSFHDDRDHAGLLAKLA
jgi:hypothetical protein